MPSSNSWLPTEVIARPTRFSASTVGSSWNAADRSGVAPMLSPAATTRVRPWVAFSLSIQVAKN